jgi:hypothetical protein
MNSKLRSVRPTGASVLATVAALSLLASQRVQDYQSFTAMWSG